MSVLRNLFLLVMLASADAWLAQTVELSSKQDAFTDIDQYVEQERQRSRIPGIALAIIRDGQIAHVRGFGTDGNGKAITGSTPFPIGSLTKSFTAVLVRQLIESGRVEVDAPLKRYLPWFSVADPTFSATISVRHLLNQTSGFSREDGVKVLIRSNGANIEQVARSTSSLELTSTPGQRYQYSNLNFVLLGALVEAMHQQPWSELIQQRILHPLGMKDTYTNSETARQHGMTEVHRYMFGVPLRTELAISPGLASTGALVASAEDMGRYVQMMLLEGESGHSLAVLRKESARAMFSPSSPTAAVTLLSTPFHFRYGEGWFVGPFGVAQDARWHLGNLPSFTAWMVAIPETRSAAIVLINANCEMPFFEASAPFSHIATGVVNLLLGQDPPHSPSVTDAYLRFNTTAATAIALTAALAWWVGARRAIWPSVVIAALSLALALAVAVAGPGWHVLFAFAPDLAICVASILLVLNLRLGFMTIKKFYYRAKYGRAT